MAEILSHLDPADTAAVEALRALVRIPTVSDRDWDALDTTPFDDLLEELRERFPLLHARLDLTTVHSHGLLVHWRGASAERPVILMAHLDVVPIDPDAPWRFEPFSAEIHDSDRGPAIWGRGTLDDKGCVAAICSAVERLLAQDFVPAQDVWLSFGCDEEVSGVAAVKAVDLLRERGVHPWFVIDEGGAVAHGAFPGVRPPVAVIGVTEKGITSLHLTAEGRGGHASTPVTWGPTTRIARALLRLERHQFPASLPEPSIALLERLAPHAPLALRPLLANARTLAPVLVRALLAAGPETAAMTRTTIAPTTLSGSPALNVIASSARAGVNFRIMIGESVAGVVEHVRRAVRDDSISIEVVEASEPSPVSPYAGDEAFTLLSDAIEAEFGDAVVSPYVVMAATDARHFTAICERVYRFAPFRMTKGQREAIHSYDEHLGVEDYLAGVRWYSRLIRALPA